MVNDDDRTPDGDDAEDPFRAASSELSDALGDLMASEAEEQDDDPGGLDLTALEEAVAELGLDVDDDGPGAQPMPAASDLLSGSAEDGPRSIDVGDDGEDTPAPASKPNPGLDLTELPRPEAPAKRKLPPLGEATADDLFGPLDDEPGLPSYASTSASVDEPAAASPSELHTPPPFEPTGPLGGDPAEAPDTGDEAIQLPAPDPQPQAEADPTMADVVGFTAHGGTITGNIRAKTKKLFGR